MSKQANPTVIGGFVLGALVLVIIGILVFGSGAWLRERIQMVTYFPGSVQGLTVGAQVLFQGVPIGQVTDIGLDFLPERDSFRIPVHYEIYPKQVHVLSREGETDAREVLARLVDEKGLRARLESVSFVTGQYLIALSLNPDLPKRTYQPSASGPIRVPALPAIRDRLEEMLQNLNLDALVNNAADTLASIKDLVGSDAFRSVLLNLNQALIDTQALVRQLDAQLSPLGKSAQRTLEDYGELAQGLRAHVDSLANGLETATRDLSRLADNLNARIEPVAGAATGALNETRDAMRAITGLTGEGSRTRYELDRLLENASGAARALRSLADYLERHPEALLKGKR